ncbi:MAG: peptidoglycan recognition family protein [Candidatus Cloacimonetes bacterium]|nr:peptidoglycan recognition family protein [Candidatus Cloacimonadota bacterium]
MKIIQKASPDFFKIKTVKDMIVLHYTGGGTLSGAEATLAIRDYVNVHYGIDDDGTIYQYFAEDYWAYHTGTNKKDAERSIGIEIRSWGHLTRVGNELRSWTGKNIEWTKVVRLAPFRGFEYWEMISYAQLEAVRELVLAISCRHPIKTVTTHARLNKNKLDFPPDYPGIKGLIYEFGG